MIKKWFVIFFIKCNIAALHWRWSTFTIYHINCESVTSKTTFRDQNEEAKDVHPRAHEWTRRWHEMGQWQRELKWVLACDWWRHNTGRGQELTHSPFTFSLHSRGERKRLIHTHTEHTHTLQRGKGRHTHLRTGGFNTNTHTHTKHRGAIKDLFTQHLNTHITVYTEDLVTTWTWGKLIVLCPSSSCVFVARWPPEEYKCVSTKFVYITYHDHISRSDTDLIMTASIKWINSSVVDHLHWRLLLVEAADCRSFLVKQTRYRTFLPCG